MASSGQDPPCAGISSAAVSGSGLHRPRRAAPLYPTEWRRRAPSETFGEIGLLSPKFSVSAKQPGLHLARKCREFGGIPVETNGGLREPRCVVGPAGLEPATTPL